MAAVKFMVSRLTKGIGQLLVDKGYDHPIPEIHQVVAPHSQWHHDARRAAGGPV